MKFNHPPTESQPRPSVVDLRARPCKAVDVLRATDVDIIESEFDPLLDISKEDENAMFGELAGFFARGSWLPFMNMARDVSLLYPDKVGKFFIDKKTAQKIKAALEIYVANDEWRSFVEIAVPFIQFFPEQKSELMLAERKSQMIEWFKEKGIPYWWRFNVAMDLISLYPDLKETMFKSSTQDQNESTPWFDSVSPVPTPNMLAFLKERDRWGDFSFQAIACILFNPSSKSKLNLDAETFNKMKMELNKFRKHKDWLDFSHMAMCLTILAADKAELTSDGRIKLTRKPGKIMKDRRPLPERSRV